MARFLLKGRGQPAGCFVGLSAAWLVLEAGKLKYLFCI